MKRTLLVGVALCLFACGNAAETGAETDPVNDDETALSTTGRPLRSVGANCLDVTAASTKDGTPLQMMDCNGGAGQRWAFPKVGATGPITSDLGKCLDIPGGKSTDGLRAQIYTCNGTAAQKWTRTSDGELKGPGGKCLDIYGGRTANGTPVQLYSCNDTSAQKWGTTPKIARFYVVGSDIVTPEGNRFLPVGANIDGWDFFQRPSDAHAEEAKQWGWNMVRVNGNQFAVPSFGTPGLVSGAASAPSFAKLDRIVSAYTSRKIVTMISFHGKVFATGGALDATLVEQTRQAWVSVANRYKANPYVWFNLLNEPIWSQSVADYVKVHASLRNSIRATGAENIVVIDGGVGGQEWPNWGVPGHLIPTQGPGLAYAQCNVAFSIHAYGAWAEANGTIHENEFRTYLKSVRDAKLALLAGETGWENVGNARNEAATRLAYRLGPPNGVGMLAWHGDPNFSDSFFFVKNNGMFWNINSATNPTNLTSLGQLVWNYGHGGAPDLGIFTGDYATSHCSTAQ